MTSISVLENIHKKGLFGDYEGKNENELVKIIERKDLLIVQIAQYKNSSTKDINIDGLKLSNEALKVNCNNDARILWSGPKNWLLTSTKKNLLENIKKTCKENDFAVTDLSHSRVVIEIEGANSKEILKKGCPYNFNELKIIHSGNSENNIIYLLGEYISNDDLYKVLALIKKNSNNHTIQKLTINKKE